MIQKVQVEKKKKKKRAAVDTRRLALTQCDDGCWGQRKVLSHCFRLVRWIYQSFCVPESREYSVDPVLQILIWRYYGCSSECCIRSRRSFKYSLKWNALLLFSLWSSAIKSYIPSDTLVKLKKLRG